MRIYWACLLIGVGLILFKTVLVLVYQTGDIGRYDNDSLMRLVSVRSWLDGQPWFDTMEYRLMPPDGVQLHWSRYIDAVLGGLVVLFSQFMPVENAEPLTAPGWFDCYDAVAVAEALKNGQAQISAGFLIKKVNRGFAIEKLLC